MARKISSRLRISGTLQAETPLHVGGYGVDVDTDLPLARNGKNQLYIPGTSIAGVLRAWCVMNFTEKDDKGNDLIGEIFGPKRRPGIEEGHASFVLIEDVKIKDAEKVFIEIRDGVGIDRFYGIAADKSKFDRAILPKGTKLEFEMIVEIAKNSDETKTKAIFGNLLEALQNQEIRFGASKTRGLGRVKLTKLYKIQSQDFNDILSWITLDEKGEEITEEDKIKAEIATLGLGGISKNDVPKLEITISWKPRLPLMNKAGYEGIGVDMLPVTSGVSDDKLSLVLAGSSIKGAFRSHAERIVRTLLNSPEETNFSKQIIVPIVKELFGGKKEKDIPDQPKSKLGLGALSFDDCYSVESFDQANWREVEQGKLYEDKSYFEKVTNTINGNKVEEVTLHRALKRIDLGTNTLTDKEAKEKTNKFHISHQTANDRFTGGASEGALYSVLAPHNIEWQPIKMSLDIGRTDGKDKCCLMLLLLILRDLAENRLPLGFATNRGMGEVKVKCIKLKGGILADYKLTDKESDEIILEGGKVSDLDENFRNDLTKEWIECLNIS